MPRFIYAILTYQNPTGAVMPRERRIELLRLARNYELIVVDGNYYGDVHFEDGAKPPLLYTLDYSPNQIYLRSSYSVTHTFPLCIHRKRLRIHLRSREKTRAAA